jgi:hypothetical protein
MEPITDLVLSIVMAGALVSLYAILRIAFRAPILNSDIPAYIAALMFTFAFAASLFYVAMGLNSVLPGGVAFFGTFAVHGAFIWLFQKLIPLQAQTTIMARAPRVASSRATA